MKRFNQSQRPHFCIYHKMSGCIKLVAVLGESILMFINDNEKKCLGRFDNFSYIKVVKDRVSGNE